MMKLGLRVLSTGKQEGKILPIQLSQFVIGRDAQCHLRPASPSISKRHCALIVREGKVLIRDFDSTNGTFVNEQPVKGQQEVKHKDKLRIGPLHFEVLLVPTPADQNASGVQKPPEKAAPAKEAVKESAEEEKTAITDSAPEPAPEADNSDKVQEEKPEFASEEPESEEEEDIAALLLSMADDDEDFASTDLNSDEVPEGSTVMEMKLPGTGDEEEGEEKDQSELAKVKEQQESTSNAAKAILDKYMKRPR